MNVAGLKLPEHAAPYVAAGAVVIVAALVVYYVGKREIASGASAIGSAVDPTSSGNVFYRGTQAVARIVTGSPDDGSFSLGAWLWEKAHPSAVKAENAVSQPINVEAAIAGAYL